MASDEEWAGSSVPTLPRPPVWPPGASVSGGKLLWKWFAQCWGEYRLRGKHFFPVHLSGPGAPQGKLPRPLKSGLCVTQGQKETKRDTPRLKWPFFSNNRQASVPWPASAGSPRHRPSVFSFLPAPLKEPGFKCCGVAAVGFVVPRIPARRPDRRKLSGAGALPSPARLTSCPWRRRGGTRCPEPRRTASCRLVPEGGDDVDAGERGAVCSCRQQRGLNAPPAGPPRSRGPRPGAPAPLHLTALGVRSSANRLPVLRVSASIGFSPASPQAGIPSARSFWGSFCLALAALSPEPKAGSCTSQIYLTIHPLQLLQRPDPSCSEKWWLRHRRETDARSRAIADTR